MKKYIYFSIILFVFAWFFRFYEVKQTTPVLYDEGVLIGEYYFCRDAIDIVASGLYHVHPISSIIQDCKKQLVYPYPKDGKYLQPILYALSSYLFGRTAYVPVYVNAVAGSLTAVGLAYVAWWFYGETAALMAGLLASVWSGLILYDRTSLGESLPLLFFVGGLIGFFLSHRNKLWMYIEGAALGCMFCCQGRYIYCVGIVFFLEFLYAQKNWKLLGKRLAIVTITCIFAILLAMSPFLVGSGVCTLIGVPYPGLINPITMLFKPGIYFDESRFTDILSVRMRELGLVISYLNQIYGWVGCLLLLLSLGYVSYRHQKEDWAAMALFSCPFLFWILIEGLFAGRFVFPVASVGAIFVCARFYSAIVKRHRLFYLLFTIQMVWLLIFWYSLLTWKSANAEIAREYPHLVSSNYNIINALKGGGKAMEFIENRKRMPTAALPKNREELTNLYQMGYTFAAVDCLYEIEKKGKTIYPPLMDLIEKTPPLRTFDHPIGASILYPMEHNLDYQEWREYPSNAKIRIYDLGQIINQNGINLESSSR